MAGNTLELTDANFEDQVLKSGVPVLVDFWAPWCGPCRMLAPTIEQIATEYSGRAVVGKLDTDQHNQAAIKYRIEGLPTLLIFKNGQVVDQLVGAQPKDKITARLNAHV